MIDQWSLVPQRSFQILIEKMNQALRFNFKFSYCLLKPAENNFLSQDSHKYVFKYYK